MSRVNQRLNGLTPLSYLGVNAYEPNDFIVDRRDPLTSDFNNFYLGTWWLNSSTSSLFYLAAVADGLATWINISSSSGAVQTLTADTGGPVSPTAGNINVVGDGTTIDIVGNPGTSTLTISAINLTPTETLTGNSGGPVSPTAGNINIVGAGPLTVTGNPGTSTLTINQSGAVSTSFVTQSGTAVPSAGALTIHGANGITTSGAGSTVTISAAGTVAEHFITNPATGTATPAAGVLTLAAGTGATIVAGGSTVTITMAGGGTSYSEGTWVPTLTFGGSPATLSRAFGYFVQIGNVVYIQFDLAVSAVPVSASGAALSLPFAHAATPAGVFMGTAQMTFSSPFSNVYPVDYRPCWSVMTSASSSSSLLIAYEPGQNHIFPIPSSFTATTAFTGCAVYYI